MTASMTMKSGIFATRISTLITAWMPFSPVKMIRMSDPQDSTSFWENLINSIRTSKHVFLRRLLVSIDPNIVMEGLEQPFPKEWLTQVSIRSRKSERFKKPDKRSFRDLLEEAFL